MTAESRADDRGDDTRPHLHAVDLVRVCTVAGVISVHVVALTTAPTHVFAGALMTVLHVNREVFFLLSAFVLTYAYGRRQSWSLRRFWAKRYWLVATPYLVWTVVYFFADHTPLSPAGTAMHVFVHDVLTGATRYHLYFLLVTMQLYLVFPALLALLRTARRHLGVLLGASVLLQLALTFSTHYGFARGVFGAWDRNATILLPSYQLYILTGAVAALHLESLTVWVRRHRHLVGPIVVGAVMLGLVSFTFDHVVLGMAPLQAGEVFQPVVVVESFAVVLGLFAWGLAWADRPQRRLGRVVAAGSDASFGVYLAHPLVLQGALALVPRVFPVHGTSAQVATLVGELLVAVPLVYLVTGVIVVALRRTRLSVALTGRRRDLPAPAKPRAPVPITPARPLQPVPIAPSLEGVR